MRSLRTDELLKKGLTESGLPSSGPVIEAFMRYLSELKKWNRAYNLTGLKRDEDIVIKHFLDSLLYLRVLPPGQVTIVDVGSGAGFPGIPLKIARPEIRIYLVEPTGKKAIFLRHILKLLDLRDACVVEKQIESTKAGEDLPAPADAAVTRALFDIQEFISKASHVVKSGGTLIVSKGPKAEEEIRELKGVNFETVTCRLPLTDMKRHLIVVKKG